MNPYIKKVQYYETDMMGIVHHANYIRWMEEARIDFLDQMGFPYARMEAEGIISPVRAVSCQYKKPCTFGDTLNIAVVYESVAALYDENTDSYYADWSLAATPASGG